MELSNEAHKELLELYTHSFVIKIWLEETAVEAERAVWRGHITHVPSGRRQYISHLDDVPLFILPYLQDMRAKPGSYWRMRQWLKNRHKPQKAKE